VFSRAAPGEWSCRRYCDELGRLVELPGFDVCLPLMALYEGIDLDEKAWRER
jgi:hypothetical protein